jgi:signal transduction histidine kinase
MADGLLDEVFYNLLSNSIKYDDHDEVTIDVDVEVLQENEKNIARVKVIDRGTGIPDDLKEKVFSRGFRQMAKADRPSLHKSKGAGMGLSLVKSLVDKYEGKIWVENRVYADHSMGSVFIVLLPVP